MELTDTHTHLFTEEFDGDFSEVISRAVEQDITRFYLPAIDSTYTTAMIKRKSLFPKRIFLMAGLHPCSVKESFRDELEKVKSFMTENEFCGIGETGLDYHWDTTFVQEQKESLHAHCRWAVETGKPIILHTRDATDDVIDIIKTYKNKNIQGIFHCFSGTYRQAEEIIDLGFYLGVGGVLTFKNSGLDKIIRNIDLNHIVLETDSPYLAPTPYRGKRNESAYIRLIAGKLAAVKECTLEEVAAITTANADKVFLSS